MNKPDLERKLREWFASISTNPITPEQDFVIEFIALKFAGIEALPDTIVHSLEGDFSTSFSQRFGKNSLPGIMSFYNQALSHVLPKIDKEQKVSSPVTAQNPMIVHAGMSPEQLSILRVAIWISLALVTIFVVVLVFSRNTSSENIQATTETMLQSPTSTMPFEAILANRVGGIINLRNGQGLDAEVVGVMTIPETGNFVYAVLDPSSGWAQYIQYAGGIVEWTTGGVYDGIAYFCYACPDLAEPTFEIVVSNGKVVVPSKQSMSAQAEVLQSQPPINDSVIVVNPPQARQTARSVVSNNQQSMQNNPGDFFTWLLGFIVLMQILTLFASFLQGDVAMFWGLIVLVILLLVQSFASGFEGEAETWVSHIVFLGLFPLGLLLISKTDSIGGVFARKIKLKDFLVTSRWELTATATYLLAVCAVYFTLGLGSVNLSATIFSWVSWFDVLLGIAFLLYLIESVMRAKYTYVLQCVMFVVIYFTNLIPSLEGIKIWVFLIALIVFGLAGIGAQIIGEEKSTKFFKAVAPELEERGITDARARIALALDYQIDPIASFLLVLFFLTLHFWGGDVSAFF